MIMYVYIFTEVSSSNVIHKQVYNMLYLYCLELKLTFRIKGNQMARDGKGRKL